MPTGARSRRSSGRQFDSSRLHAVLHRLIGLIAVGSTSDRILRVALWLLLAVVTAIAWHDVLARYAVGIDVEIPLRAAQRWIGGGQPYLPESFLAPPGPDLPFLYPPFVLPFIAPLLVVPRWLIAIVWAGIELAVAASSCRRLAIPWRWVPLVLCWPPFAEGLLGGNIQVVLFGAFVGLLFGRPGRGRDFRPTEVDLRGSDRPAVTEGLLGAANGALKATQVHPWFVLLRDRPRAAIAGAVAVVAVVLVTLPFTGLALWFDWIAQAARASDPGWRQIGVALTQYLPPPLPLVVLALSVMAAPFLPRRHRAAWLGVLMVLATPTLRVYGLLFLLPGMLVIRMELALLAALAISTYTYGGTWIAIALVVLPLAFSLREHGWLEDDGGCPRHEPTGEHGRIQ